MAHNGMRGTGSFPPAQRPGNFGGKINLVSNARVSREQAAARVKASKQKSMKGKRLRFKKFVKE